LTKKLREKIQLDEGSTLNDLLKKLYEIYGEEFKDLIWDKKDDKELNKLLSIIVNGKNYRDEKFLDTKLKENDDLTFLYIYFGG
jgi:molybdopterin converting factor small subunit